MLFIRYPGYGGECSQDIINKSLIYWSSSKLSLFPTFPLSVVDFNPWLAVVDKYMVTNAFTLIFDRVGLHLHAAGDQLVIAKIRGNTVEYMVR